MYLHSRIFSLDTESDVYTEHRCCIGNLHMQRYLLEVWADLCASSQVTGWLTNSGGKMMVLCSSNQWAMIPLKTLRKLISAPSCSKQTILQSRSNVLDEPHWPTILVENECSLVAWSFSCSRCTSTGARAWARSWTASLHASTRPLVLCKNTPPKWWCHPVNIWLSKVHTGALMYVRAGTGNR